MPTGESRKFKSGIYKNPAKSTIRRTKTVVLPRASEDGTEQPKYVSLKPRGLPLGLKYALLTALAITIAIIIVVIISYVSIRNEVEDQINESGIMLTNVLSGFDVEFWKDAQKNNKMEQIKAANVINFLVTEEKGADVFLVASLKPPQQYKLENDRSLKITPDDIEIRELDYSEQTGETDRIRTRAYRKELLDKSGKGTDHYITLFISARKIDEVLNSLFIIFLLPAFLAIAIGAGLGLWMASQVTKPIKNLIDDMEEVSGGNLEHQSTVSSQDEIGVLTKVFNRMTNSLKAAHDKELEAKALEHELNIAHEIQANLLPKKIPEIPGYDIATYYRASKEVGGDYYDIINIDESNIGIIVADVSGKGIPGSMVMTMARSLVRMEAGRNPSAADTLIKVNRIMATDIRRGMFVTALYIVLNIKNHTALVSSAGHNPLVIWRKKLNKHELVNPNGIALGFDRGPVFERTIKEVTINLSWGDRLVGYTDGVVESMNQHDEEFGSERFYNLVNRLGEIESRLFINKVMEEIDAHQGNAPQHDDITLISCKFSG
ncbi:MAG: PP2C family protein-serine/threonine phosphatase [Planctomycetes bacterium]|nr:PP2C family protein-serine/threonine phosphatase [Planctomycetota bacterium]